MKQVLCLSAVLLLLVSLLTGCPSSTPETPAIPAVTAFTINDGDATASDRTVILNNTCTGVPTQYMASEASDFTGASWNVYTPEPSFTLSSGNSAKTVYFKVKNALGESPSINDTIALDENNGSGTEETVMLPGNVPLEMRWCPAGTFMMGATANEQGSWDGEKPQHQVTLSHGFWIGKFELTKRQWTAVMGSTPWSGQEYITNDLESPAVYVSWIGVQQFIATLNSLTGKTFRLPTEAEWEYACRAGTTTRYYWGDDPDLTLLGDYSWNYYNADNVEGQRYAHIVGQKTPNAFGLYDMSGNVWEMVQDYWDNYPSAASITDPTGPQTSLFRVSRGGAWNSVGYGFCRSAFRTGFVPEFTHCYSGFRLSR